MEYSQNNIYQRQNAINYAIKYGMNPNPNFRYFKLIGNNGGDCTNFVSQCLLYGGAPMAYTRVPWWYRGNGNMANDTWSPSWAVAHSLYWSMKIRNEQNLPGLSAVEVNDTSLLEIGDVIQISDQNNVVFHSAIITGFSGNMPLITQHTFNAVNLPLNKTYEGKRHYMKIIVHN